MSGLLSVVSLVLIGVGGAFAQFTCQCNYGALRGLQVCGTDGKTYPTPCDLVNTQRANSALGLKCLGPCPCPASSPAVSKVCIRQGLWSALASTTAMPTTTPAVQPPGPIQPFSNNANAIKPGRRHGGRHGHGGRSDSSSSEERHHGGRPQGPPVCLTNGTTVYDPVSVRCAVANPNTPDVGLRCFGPCRFCAVSPMCPGRDVVSGSTQQPGGQTGATQGTTGATTAAAGAGTPEPIIDFLAQSKAVFQNAAFN